MNTSKKHLNYSSTLTLTICFLFLLSCKTKYKVVESITPAPNKNILKAYLSQMDKQQFTTVYFNSSVNYTSATENQNLTADIKIEHNKTIWISLKAMGFPVAKALITPTEVKYYEKMNRTFFEGDFSILSTMLGTQVDFYILQNLLLGRSLVDLKTNLPTDKNGKLITALDDGYILETVLNKATQLLLEQKVSNVTLNRDFKTHYASFLEENLMPFPNQFSIFAKTNKETKVTFKTRKIIVNQPLRMVYNVPENCKQIYIQ